MSVILPPTPTKNIGRLLNYGHAGEAHHGDGPRAIFEAGYLCSPETAQAEMMATLREYGKLDGDFVQGLHVIDSYGFDEVDPNDVSIDDQGRDVWDRLEAKFEESRTKARLMFPGNQISSYGQVDGASGKFHVHHVVCAVVKEEASYPGIVKKRGDAPVAKAFKAGRSLNGELRNVARLRRVNDDWMKQHLGVDNKERMKAPKDRVSIREVEATVVGETHWREMLKARIREVSAHAESLEEFVEKLAGHDVEARPSNRGGKAGISYAITWSDDKGVEHVDKAVTAGRTGIGADYGRAALDVAFENNRALRREREAIARFEAAIERMDAAPVVGLEAGLASMRMTDERRAKLNAETERRRVENEQRLQAFLNRDSATTPAPVVEEVVEQVSEPAWLVAARRWYEETEAEFQDLLDTPGFADDDERVWQERRIAILRDDLRAIEEKVAQGQVEEAERLAGEDERMARLAPRFNPGAEEEFLAKRRQERARRQAVVVERAREAAQRMPETTETPTAVSEVPKTPTKAPEAAPAATSRVESALDKEIARINNSRAVAEKQKREAKSNRRRSNPAD